MKIRKDDIVTLPDESVGTVLETVATESMAVYKINHEGHIQYFDESKVRLKKRHLRNLFLSIFRL